MRSQPFAAIRYQWHTSMNNYVKLAALGDVIHTIGVQCKFGALPSALKTCKTSSWFHFGLELPSLRSSCNHQAGQKTIIDTFHYPDLLNR